MTDDLNAAALLALAALTLRKKTTSSDALAGACEQQALRLSPTEPVVPFGKAVQPRTVDGQGPAKLDDFGELEELDVPGGPLREVAA